MRDTRPDHALIRALNAGDSSAFDSLFYRYRDRVLRLAFRFTGNEADALDVMQDCFAYLIGKFPGFELTSSMTTFLFPVVRNLSLAQRRKRRKFEPADSIEEMAGFAHVDLDESRAELASAMANLPANQRETMLLRFVDDLSIEEIAVAMDVPEGTVKSRIHHAIATLRQDPRARRYFL